MTIDIIEGWTGDIDWQLFGDSDPVNITGATISLELFNADGAAVTLVGTFVIVDAATGKVRFNPDATDLSNAKSPYRMRTKVTDGTGKIVYFPSGRASDVLRVHVVNQL